MLRLIFASGLLAFGFAQVLRGPFYALLLYLGIAYFRPEAWIWGDQLQALNLSFTVGAYVLVATLFSKERLTFRFPVWLIGLFCLHGLLASTFSDYHEWCFPWWKAFAKTSIIAILIIGLINTEERLRLALFVIVFALGFEGTKQGWYSLISGAESANANGLESLGDNNGVAVGMVVLASLLLGLLQSTSRWLKPLMGFMVLGVLFRALTTYSRGGLLAFATMSTMYWARSKHRLRTGILVVVVGLALLPLMPSQYWDRMATIMASSESRDESAASRLHFWRVAIHMANDHPLLGVGQIGFQPAYDRYDWTGGEHGRQRAVHSSWFGVLADQGYVGLAMFAALFVAAFHACSHARAITREVNGHEALFALATALQTALAAVAVGGSFLSFHYIEILWHLFGLSFALQRISRSLVASEAADVTVAHTLPQVQAGHLSPLGSTPLLS